jgi:glycosyltransferase involved in cell wall biosynthesis
LNLRTFVIPRLARHVAQCRASVNSFNPDIIWACSDSFHAILGVWLGKSTRTKCLVDLYDNYESFGANRIPGVLRLFKNAVSTADGVTCVSQQLAAYVTQHYKRRGPILTLENAVRPDLFYPRDKTASRKELRLPGSAKIVGTAGALSRSRGIDTLFRAFESLAAHDPSLHLAIAGPRDYHTRIPSGPRVHYLGVLPLEKVPIFINSLDVAAVCNRDSSFGHFNFPQKAYEIIGCRVPLVASAVGTMKDLLAEYPQCLFEPENTASCAAALTINLNTPTPVYLEAPTWSEKAKQLQMFFLEILTSRE